MLIVNSDIAFEEVNLRTAVGRAYYAAFRSICDYEAGTTDFTRKRGIRDHGTILAHLEEMDRDEWAGDLRLLRRLRNQCDYDERVADLREKADIALDISRNLKYEALRATP